MKKVLICLAGSILAIMGSVLAQEAKPVQDSARIITDTALKQADSARQMAADNAAATRDDARLTESVQPAQATQAAASPKEEASSSSDGNKKDWDTRWFIAPLTKFQLQDFAMLEKNRKGYLSDANTLPFQGRGNMSFAASLYKNITGRLSISGDIGFSYGHVTSTSVLLSQTKTKTFNLLNATLYYHLLSAKYRLQPFVALGINNLTNDKSYTSAPMGVGVKFNSKSRKIMLTGQASYGYAVSKSIAPTVIYSVGMYLPLNNKKRKKADLLADSLANANNANKDDAKNKDKNKNDSTSKGGVTNNIYITINMDSIAKAHGYTKDEGDDEDGSGSGRRGRGKRSKEEMSQDEEKLSKFDTEEFGSGDFKMDTVDGRPVLKLVVYFEFNEYALTSKAFSTIDKIIYQLRKNPNLVAEVKGYTDNVGTAEYNNMLSRKRAQIVFDYLNSKGVPSDKMSSQYFGKDDPVANNADPNTAWLNRRAEIIIHVKDK